MNPSRDAAAQDPAQYSSLATALADRYRILRQLGMGGMAVVYLAEDLKHKRQVAVKVLKPELAAILGAERFLHEITITAALQHPHILPLFDSGSAEGQLYYVMPFVDGETLRARLDRETQLPVADAVSIARDVADALHHAHSHGVVHRDIKPENIILAGGRPMVVDFGIALAVSAAAGNRFTETGLSLGTPHYMSPEQATADREITARSDIYSLATVLYEMLAGVPPHTGASAQQVIMKIVTEDAEPVTKYRRNVPANVAAATAHALEKLPADRFASAKELGDALANPAYTSGVTPGATPTTATAGSSLRRRFQVAVAVAALTGLAGFVIGRELAPPSGTSGDRPVMHLRIPYPFDDDITFQSTDGMSNAFRPSRSAFVFTSDGRSLIIAAQRGAERRLYLRRLDGQRSVPIDGTEGAENPFLSPDGEWIGFWTTGKLRRVPIGGGAPTDIATVGRIAGATWHADGRIAVGSTAGVILISADGTTVDTIGPPRGRLPVWMPDGKRLLYTHLRDQFDIDQDVEILDLASGTSRVVVRGGADARLLSTGHLLFARRGSIFVVGFDPSTGTTKGSPATVADDVMQAMNASNTNPRTGQAQFAVSPTGDMVYLTGGLTPDRGYGLAWFDRAGRQTPLTQLGPRWYLSVRFSPDEKRIVFTTRGIEPSLHVVDLGRQAVQTLQTASAPNYPMWTPDGTRIVHSVRIADSAGLVIRAADGGRGPEPFRDGLVNGWPAFWSADGRTLFSSNSNGLWANTASGGAVRVDGLPTSIRHPTLSPDGGMIAYSIGEGERDEVYIQPWPALDRRVRVSTIGGISPAWTKGGRELLYLREASRDSVGMIAYEMISVNVSPDLEVSTPVVLFTSNITTTTGVRTWDVTKDGSRIIGITSAPAPARPGELHVIVNWATTLGRR